MSSGWMPLLPSCSSSSILIGICCILIQPSLGALLLRRTGGLFLRSSYRFRVLLAAPAYASSSGGRSDPTKAAYLYPRPLNGPSTRPSARRNAEAWLDLTNELSPRAVPLNPSKTRGCGAVELSPEAWFRGCTWTSSTRPPPQHRPQQVRAQPLFPSFPRPSSARGRRLSLGERSTSTRGRPAPFLARLAPPAPRARRATIGEPKTPCSRAPRAPIAFLAARENVS